MSSLLRKAQNKLKDLQNKRIQLLDQCGSQFGATIVNGRVRFGIQQENVEPVYQVAFIAVSTKNPKKNNKQLGGYSVVWLDKGLPNQYGYYNGSEGALIFPLMAVRDTVKECPKDRPLIICCNNPLIINFLNGRTPTIKRKNNLYESYLDTINYLIEIRNASTVGFYFDANTRNDWIQSFYDVAKSVARETLELWYAEKDTLTTRPNPALPSPVIESTSKDSFTPTSETNLHDVAEEIRTIMVDLRDIENIRKTVIEAYKDSVDKHENQLEEEVAVIAMSVDTLAHDQRLGGYGAVWLNSNIENHFGTHEGKFENTLIFLVMALADVILQCPVDRSLMIASKNLFIVNFLNGDHPSISKKNQALTLYLDIIDKKIKDRSKPIRGVLLQPGIKEEYLFSFYKLARSVANDGRRLRYIERPSKCTSSLKLDSPRTTGKQEQIHNDACISDRDQSPIEQSPLITGINGNNLFQKAMKQIENERKRLAADYTVFHPKSDARELNAIVGMSTERPDRKGNQLGGYGIVWTDKELPSLYGHYDGPFNNTAIFILKAVIDILVRTGNDRYISIGMKNKAAYECLTGKIVYQSILKNYVKAITQLNAIRLIPAQFFLIDNRDVWDSQFHNIARRIASEARKLRLSGYAFDNDSQMESTPLETQVSLSTDREVVQEVLPIASPSGPDNPLTSGTNPLEKQLSSDGIHPMRAATREVIGPSSSSTTSIDNQQQRQQQANIGQTNRSRLSDSVTPGPNPTPVLSLTRVESSTLRRGKSPSGSDFNKNKESSTINMKKRGDDAVVMDSISPRGPTNSNNDDETTIAEAGRNDEHSINTVVTTNKRPVSSIEANVALLETSKKPRRENDIDNGNDSLDKLLDFSEWHAATKSMLEWVQTMHEKIK